MNDLPSNVSFGEIARLIPVIADNRKEQRATSVFLATLTSVPQFAQNILASIGQRIGRKTQIDSYTEVVLSESEGDARDRPDGLIRLKSGNSEWTALVEAKIGKSNLDKDQVEKYLRLARKSEIETVVTISNQFATLPDHHPLQISKTLTKKVDLFHWSWSFILTEAILLQENKVLTDPDQAFILREFVRFFSHESAGVTGLTQMPTDWKTVIDTLQTGGSLKRFRQESEAVVASWHQELRDLALGLSRHLATKVTVRMSNKHRKDMSLRLADDMELLERKHLLKGSYEITDAASELCVEADLKSRLLSIHMEVNAPADKATGKARVNWLLRHLAKAEPDQISVSAVWPSRAPDTVRSLEELRADPTAILTEGNKTAPRSFKVCMIVDDPKRFAGRKSFIEMFDTKVPYFYDNVGQHLRKWQPKPPKPVKPGTSIDKDVRNERSTKKHAEKLSLVTKKKSQPN